MPLYVGPLNSSNAGGNNTRAAATKLPSGGETMCTPCCSNRGVRVLVQLVLITAPAAKLKPNTPKRRFVRKLSKKRPASNPIKKIVVIMPLLYHYFVSSKEATLPVRIAKRTAAPSSSTTAYFARFFATTALF